MNIQVDPTSSNLASAMLNLKIRPRAVVGYGVKIFHPSPPNYVTRSPGCIVGLQQPMAATYQINDDDDDDYKSSLPFNYLCHRSNSIDAAYVIVN